MKEPRPIVAFLRPTNELPHYTPCQKSNSHTHPVEPSSSK